MLMMLFWYILPLRHQNLSRSWIVILAHADNRLSLNIKKTKMLLVGSKTTFWFFAFWWANRSSPLIEISRSYGGPEMELESTCRRLIKEPYFDKCKICNYSTLQIAITFRNKGTQYIIKKEYFPVIEILITAP